MGLKATRMRQPVATSWGTACNNTPAASSAKTRLVSWHHTGPTDTRSVSDEGGRPSDIKSHENSSEAHATLLVIGIREVLRRGVKTRPRQSSWRGCPPDSMPTPFPKGTRTLGGGVR